MAQKFFSSFTIALALVFISALPGFSTNKVEKTVETTLNGLHITFMVVINTSAHPQVVNFDVALTPWIKSATGNFKVTQFDENGLLVSTSPANAQWHGKSKNLEPNEMTLIEFQGK